MPAPTRSKSSLSQLKAEPSQNDAAQNPEPGTAAAPSTLQRFNKSTSLPAIFCALCVLCGSILPARAADYAIQRTFWSVANFTNITGAATNLAAAIDCTQFSEFLLHIECGITNPAAGTLDVRWEKSGSGTFLTTNVCNAPGFSGWFSIPLTNMGTKPVWTTNIPMGATGYWSLSWASNKIGQSLTSIVVVAYVKPKRTARDF